MDAHTHAPTWMMLMTLRSLLLGRSVSSRSSSDNGLLSAWDGAWNGWMRTACAVGQPVSQSGRMDGWMDTACTVDQSVILDRHHFSFIFHSLGASLPL